ncbi:MAG: acyltransferase [Candidatus Sumerlaeaceae bacterium]
MTTAANAHIFPNCDIGPDSSIGAFVVIGEPPAGEQAGGLVTRIGASAIIRSHTVIYAGNSIGDHFQSGHGALIREHNQIDDHVSIGSHSIIEHHVQIGNRVRIHSNAFVPEYTILENGCWLGPNVCITNASHPLCPNYPECRQPVIVQRNAKIGANVTILPGIVIGEMSLVGAGAVVTKNVPAGVVVAGNPAVILRTVDEIVCSWDQLTKPYLR